VSTPTITAGHPSSHSSLNKRLKGWPGWIVLIGVALVALLIGATRSSGPVTDDDRVDGISQRLACPICDGESVYESQSSAAVGIKAQIRKLVEDGQFSDDQIIAYISGDAQFGAQTLLVPKATGFDSLVWILPVFAGVCAIAGLAVVFRRWKSAADTVPTEADRALVEQALLEETDDD
jgi:cytochrome c-type biogenesis protein CcmH